MTTNHDLRAYRQMMVARNPNATEAQIDAAVIEYDRYLDECAQHEKTNRATRRSEARRIKRERAKSANMTIDEWLVSK